MDLNEGFGKATRARRFGSAARRAGATPYARPGPVARQEMPDDEVELLTQVLAKESPSTSTRSQLFGSVLSAAATPFRAAAGFLSKVRRRDGVRRGGERLVA